MLPNVPATTMFTIYEIVTSSTLLSCPDMSLLEEGGGVAVVVVVYGVVEGMERKRI
jgi:hypothetical protein